MLRKKVEKNQLVNTNEKIHKKSRERKNFWAIFIWILILSYKFFWIEKKVLPKSDTVKDALKNLSKNPVKKVNYTLFYKR